ncbi:unnamed protein product [Absidia cylindrospora]
MLQSRQPSVNRYLTKDTAPTDTHTFVKCIIENSYSSYAIIMITISYLFRLKPRLDKALLTASFADRRYLSCGRRMFYAALILATKYHIDEAPVNRHWSIVSGLPANQISQTEELFLKLMDYRLHITKEAYEQWATLIQRHCGRHPSHCSNPCHPSAAYTFQYPFLPTPIAESVVDMVLTQNHGDEEHEQPQQRQQLLNEKQNLQQLPSVTYDLQQQIQYLEKQYQQQQQQKIHQQNQLRNHPRLQQFHQYQLPPWQSHLPPQQLSLPLHQIRPLQKPIEQQPLQQINRQSQYHFQYSPWKEQSQRQQVGQQQSSSPAASTRPTIRRRKPRRYVTIRSTNRRSKSAKTIQIKVKSLNGMKWMGPSINQLTRVLLPPFTPIRLTRKVFPDSLECILVLILTLLVVYFYLPLLYQILQISLLTAYSLPFLLLLW